MLEKMTKKTSALIALGAWVAWLVVLVSFLITFAALPQAVQDLEDRIAYNDEVTLAVARYVIGKAHNEYTYQGYVYRFALEHVLAVYHTATAIQPDPMLSAMVAEIEELPMKVGR